MFLITWFIFQNKQKKTCALVLKTHGSDRASRNTSPNTPTLLNSRPKGQEWSNQSRGEGRGVLLGDAAQPRAHPHELQQAVHPIGDSDVGEPDLHATTQKKKKKRKEKGTTAAAKDARGQGQEDAGNEWKEEVRQELKGQRAQKGAGKNKTQFRSRVSECT